MKLYLGNAAPIEVTYINTSYTFDNDVTLYATFTITPTSEVDSVLVPLMGAEFEGFRVVGADNEKLIYSYSNLAFKISSYSDWCDNFENRQITLTIQQIV